MNVHPTAPARRRRAILAAALVAGAVLAAGAARADTASGSGSRMPAGGAFMSSYSSGPYGDAQRPAPAFEPSATGSVAPFAPPSQREPRRLLRRR